MFCNNCGAKLDENAIFCGECGSKVAIPVAQETDTSETTEGLSNSSDVCRNCGAELDPNGLFCGECGTLVDSLDSSQVVQPNDQNTYQENTQYVNQEFVAQPLNQGYELSEEQLPVKEAEKSKENLTPLIAALAVVLVVCSSIIWFALKWGSNPISIDIPVSEEQQSEELNSADTADNDEDGERNDNSEVDSTKARNDEPESDEVETVPALDDSEPAAVAGTNSATPNEVSDEPVAQDDFLFPSDRELITEDYLMTLTKEEVALIRNEIYARHGYIFQTEPFRTYFSNKSWYVPNENFNDSLLSEIEKANADAIIAFEEKMGWR